MEAICVPSFLIRSSGRQLLTHVQEYGTLCRHLAVSHERGVDSAGDIMKHICRRKRIYDLPALRALYDFLSSTVFEYHARAVDLNKTLPCNSACDCFHCLPPGLELLHIESTSPNIKQMEINTDDGHGFSEELLETWLLELKMLEQRIEDHAYKVQCLKHAHKKYLKLKGKEGLLSLQMRSKMAALSFAADSGDGHFREPIKDIKKTQREVNALEVELKRLNENISETYMLVMHSVTDEVNARESMICRAHNLELHMRSSIKGIIQMATGMLSMVFDSVDFSSAQRDKLLEYQDSFAHTAKQIFRGLSDKYTFVDYEVFDSTTPIPNTYIMKSTAGFKSGSSCQQKDESRAALLGDVNRPENVYVKVITDRKQTPVANMAVAFNTRLKLKVCSADGAMAFGWKRDHIGGKKTWGFYSTDIVKII